MSTNTALALNEWQQLAYDVNSYFNVNDKLILLEAFKNGPPTIEGMKEILRVVSWGDKIEALEKELDELESNFERKLEDANEELQDEISDLEGEVSDLRKENKKYENTISELESQLAEYKKKLDV